MTERMIGYTLLSGTAIAEYPELTQRSVEHAKEWCRKHAAENGMTPGYYDEDDNRVEGEQFHLRIIVEMPAIEESK